MTAKRSSTGSQLLRSVSITFAIAGLLACASVSRSKEHLYRLASSELRVSARAERGFLSDSIVIAVNGVDVAAGPFGPAEAVGTVLRGTSDDVPVVARCGHRWRPGLHIGYRCFVEIGAGESFRLDF